MSCDYYRYIKPSEHGYVGHVKILTPDGGVINVKSEADAIRVCYDLNMKSFFDFPLDVCVDKDEFLRGE